jgi:hypothetical protein
LAADEPIGIDSEWRPSMNVFHQPQGPSILQLSDSKHCFIVDLIQLKKSTKLSDALKELFNTRLIVGFGFQTDILQIKQFIVQNA